MEIVQEAKAVTRGYHDLVGRQMAENAESYVFEKLPTYRDVGNGLRAWVRTILRNYCNDLFRKSRRRPTVSLEAVAPEKVAHEDRGPAHTGADADRFFAAINEALVQWSAAPSEGSSNYAAIFAFQVLLQLRNRTARSFVGEGDPPSVDVIRRLPLNEQAWAGVFRPGCPSVRSLWEGLTDVLDTDGQVTGKDVCSVLNDRFGVSPPIKLAGWLKWLERSREKARGRLGESVWQDHFAWLLRGSGGRP